jgi:hypothetical protein
MFAWTAIGVCYLLVPYTTYHVVLGSTGSLVASWIAAATSIPVVVVAYVRVFEWFKRKSG